MAAAYIPRDLACGTSRRFNNLCASTLGETKLTVDQLIMKSQDEFEEQFDYLDFRSCIRIFLHRLYTFKLAANNERRDDLW